MSETVGTVKEREKEHNSKKLSFTFDVQKTVSTIVIHKILKPT